MDEYEKSPPRGDSAELKEYRIDSTTTIDIGTKPSRTQAANATAAIKDLTIEAAVEAAHIASISARHFCENVEIGDLVVAEHNLGVAIAHLREAAAQFRAWQGKPLGNGGAR